MHLIELPVKYEMHMCHFQTCIDFIFFRNTFLDRGANRFIMAIFVNTLGRRSTKWKFTKWAIKGKNLERVWIYCKWPEEGIVRHAFCPPAVWVAIKSDMCHGNRDINNLTKLWKYTECTEGMWKETSLQALKNASIKLLDTQLTYTFWILSYEYCNWITTRFL